MSDIKLFRTANGTVIELDGRSVEIERSLQTLVEQHLETFLGIRFLAVTLGVNLGHLDRRVLEHVLGLTRHMIARRLSSMQHLQDGA